MIVEYDTVRLEAHSAVRRAGGKPYEREIVLEGGPIPGSLGCMELEPDRIIVAGGAYYPSVQDQGPGRLPNWRDYFDISKPLVYVWRPEEAIG